MQDVATCATHPLGTRARVPWDVVGISAILPNVTKVKAMCERVRRHTPQATIVVGGLVANRPGLRELVSADQVVRGEGVRWFRRFLGEPEGRPIRHLLISSAFDSRTMGVRLGCGRGETAATLIPSVGCPLGCNFCSTSAVRGQPPLLRRPPRRRRALLRDGRPGARARRALLLRDGRELPASPRALRLLEPMRAHDKAWALYVFSSANALRRYRDEDLLGLESRGSGSASKGEASGYSKLPRGTK